LVNPIKEVVRNIGDAKSSSTIMTCGLTLRASPTNKKNCQPSTMLN
jgi:hypothetical protein